MQPVNVNLVGTDWEFLRNQKEHLLILRDQEGDESGLTTGLIHFLDCIQDQAAETVGGDTVFGPENDKDVVEIVINGGAIQDISMPDNVRVVVKDYDVPFDLSLDIRKDSEGDSYQYMEFTNV